MKNKFLWRPTKKDTLATKQKARIERFNHVGKKLPVFISQRWLFLGETLGVAILFLTNLYLLYPFFGHEDRMNVFSAPVVPVLSQVIEGLAPFSYGVRIWLLIFLIFFPLTYYLFIKEISGRRLTGLLACSIAILPVGFFLPLRINLGLLGEDGGHIASLAMIPLACLFLLRFLKNGHFGTGVAASILGAMIALTSPIGFLVLATYMVILAFSEMLLGQGRLKGFRFLIVLVFLIGFSAFWYNPKFVVLTLQSPTGHIIKKTFSNLIPVSFFTFPVLGVFGFLLFENRARLQPIFIAFFLTIAFGLFSLGAGVAHTAPSRFLAAFGISLAFFLAITLVSLFDFLRFSPIINKVKFLSSQKKRIAYGLITASFAIIVLMIGLAGRNLKQLENTQVLGLASEKKVGVWAVKQKTGPVESIFGYTITGLTGLGIVVLKKKLKV